MSEYPHTIEAGGERLTFLRRASDEQGERLEVENRVKPGAGPPMHVHHFQEESLTVQEGTIGWVEEGGDEQTAGPGATVTFGPGVSHRFWNAGDDDLVCTGYISPPDNVEYFLTEIYASIDRNGGERPGFFDGAWLSTHFRDEFAMTAIPGPVRRFLFPVVAAVGGLLGKNKRFADAPEPRRA